MSILKKADVTPIKSETGKGAARNLLAPFEEMERVFENMMSGGWLRPWRFDWPQLGESAGTLAERFPKVDIIDRESDVIVKAELPGVEKKDLDITLTDNTLTIKGSSKTETKEEKGDYYRAEISRGSFTRTMSLPADVKAGDAKAVFANGVLELTLPKKESVKRHKVEIQ